MVVWKNLTTKGVVLQIYPCAQEAELGGWYAPYQSKVCNHICHPGIEEDQGSERLV